MKSMAKALMGLGWKLREGQKSGPYGLQFAFAVLFLLISAVIFRLKRDFYGYAESLDHIVYWLKMLSLGTQRLALHLAQHALSTMRQHRPEKRTNALRAVISMRMAMGNYHTALGLIEEYIELQDKPWDRADMLTHKAVCLQKLGQVRLGLYTVNDAIVILEVAPQEVRSYAWAVWFTKALLVKAQILSEQGNGRVAKEFVELALEYATWYKANARIAEATALLEVM